MLGVLWLMFVYSLGLAFWNGTWGQALLVGGGTAVVMSVLNQWGIAFHLPTRLHRN